MSRAGGRRLRTGVALMAAVTMVALAGCSIGTSKEDSATTSAPGRSTGAPSTSTPPATGAVPGDCTESECPDLPGSSAQLMRGTTTAENAEQEVPKFLTEVLNDLDESWGKWFAQLKWGDPTVGRVLIKPGDTFTSQCTDEDGKREQTESDTLNAYFCGVDEEPDANGVKRDGAVILPVETFVKFWKGEILGAPSDFSGEFTAATVVAHEYGHNVQQKIIKQGNIPESKLPKGSNYELMADCFAGNWAATALKQNQLKPSDILQAVALVGRIGDPAPGLGHGTAPERALAMTRGFRGGISEAGQPINCLTTYWPEVFGAQS